MSNQNQSRKEAKRNAKNKGNKGNKMQGREQYVYRDTIEYDNEQGINKESNGDKYLFFPGELYQYSKDFMLKDLFVINNGLQITKKPGILVLPEQKQQNGTIDRQGLLSIGKYYSANVDDLVIGVVTGKIAEMYRIDIGTYCNALLNKKELDGNKNSKIEYEIGDLILSKVMSINKNDTPLLTCLNEKKKTVENYCDMPLGRLVNGNIYAIPLTDIVKLSKQSDCIKKIKRRYVSSQNCSICVGDNGKLWINCENIAHIRKIYNIILTYTHNENNTEIIDKMISEL